MIVSLNGPKVKLPQYSYARIHLQIGDNFIQTGWIKICFFLCDFFYKRIRQMVTGGSITDKI